MLAPKNKCTGCAACANACPVNAIKMVEDSTGFLYPQIIDDSCINCRKCEKACPVISPLNVKVDFDAKIYMFQHFDDAIRKESTSGGAFTAIAEKIIEKNGVVFGASFDSDWCVRHTYTETAEGLSQFRNSKYVQSEIRNTFQEAKAFLDSGRYVLYSGTPCQILGLKKFLGSDYKKLITVDLICLAIPSPKVFRKYLELRGNNLSNIKSIQFRNKDYGYSYPTMLIKNEKRTYRAGSESDEWLRLFLKKYSTRSSCAECIAQGERCSDFTIYDCNNLYEKNLSIDDDKGTSNIIIHTQKAHDLFMTFSPNHITVKNDEIVTSRPKKAEKANDIDYARFYLDLDQLTPKQFFSKYAPLSTKIKLLRYGRMISYKLGVYKRLRRFIRNARKNRR